jgi:hypothetical protein
MEIVKMPATLEKTRAEALQLPEKERAQLAHLLIASLEIGNDNASADWDVEIARRVAEIDRGEARGRAASDVIQDIRLRFS